MPRISVQAFFSSSEAGWCPPLEFSRRAEATRNEQPAGAICRRLPCGIAARLWRRTALSINAEVTATGEPSAGMRVFAAICLTKSGAAYKLPKQKKGQSRD
jgi:hypothetical protein